MPIPQQRDPERARRQLTAWLATKLPAATDLSLSELTGPAATGFSNDTLLFDATWTERGERCTEALVARVEPSGYRVFPEIDVGLQHAVMKVLGARSDVPVPRVWWLERDESVLGSPFFLMSRVEGEIPTDNPPYTLEGFVLEAAPAQRERLWWSGLEAMAKVHRLDWRALGLDFVSRPAFGPPGIDQQLGYYERYFEWAARGRPQPIAEAAWAWLRANRPAGAADRVALCWGDSRISNQIFRDFECVAVLDWEMVTLGDPQQDLAWWIFLDRHFTEGIGLPRLEGFPSYEDTAARWEELTAFEADALDWYQVFAGFRFAVIMMRLSQMLVAYELVPPDSDMETNNIVTQLLAQMLELPPPGEPIRL